MSDLREIERHSHNPLVRYFRNLGPGLVTGAADDDPSGITTYSVAGASLGYGMLWMALATFPLMAAVQLVCARIGLVSGRGLAAAIRRHYPRPFLYVACLLLLIANVFNIAADLSGMADVTHMLTGVLTVVSVPVLGLVILLATIYTTYATFARSLKWLTAVLFAYVVTAFLARPDWRQVAVATFVPRLRWDSVYMTTVVAVLGTTISPYLFFWQASYEVEAEKARAGAPWRSGGGRPRTSSATRASTSAQGCSSRTSSCSSSSSRPARRFTCPARLRSRARARRPRRCGRWPATEPYLLFAIGLIGTGLLAIPVLAGSASFAVAEVFRLALGPRSHASARPSLLSGVCRCRGRRHGAEPRRERTRSACSSLGGAQRAPGSAAARPW